MEQKEKVFGKSWQNFRIILSKIVQNYKKTWGKLIAKQTWKKVLSNLGKNLGNKFWNNYGNKSTWGIFCVKFRENFQKDSVELWNKFRKILKKFWKIFKKI